ncbi:MAG: glutamate--tRNA ligase [Gammaproteobacteria bacterium]|nr:glutamate--tRNA ligase [Gammaproteobacteria bacterium]NNC98140.1 glutamate--tRNA ligase [Gammaproteobacteria bacterium]NNM12966.1 glutamate--tRNA ligase [Gammaproteobacteria bacterium]
MTSNKPTPISRFAPSPTGNIHLGNVRTALFSYLLAKHLHGDFILRCEDTDQERSDEAFLQQQQRDLRWLGLDWSAGPDMDSAHGPYRQSQRFEIYDGFYKDLIEKGIAYACFCSPQELKMMRKAQMQSGRPPRYSGTCRHLSADEVAAKFTNGEKASLRFRVPSDETMQLHDLVVGEKTYHSNDIGDFIIRRSDGTPAFFFCNAIDDSLMGVTHVLRGVDHLTNTPRQLMILNALNLRAPEYGHISLVVGADGGPLSKRDGSTGVKDLREAGYLPEAIVNHLARLGHHYANNDLMPLAQLAKEFALEHCGRSPSKHDPVQLLHWQKEAVLAADESELLAWLAPWLEQSPAYQASNPETRSHFFQTIKDNIALPVDAVQWADKLLGDSVAYSDKAREQLQSASAELFDDLADRVKQNETQAFGALVKESGKALGIKGKALFMPIRAALSGETFGPEMPRIAELLGPEKIIQRLHKAQEQIV